MTAVRAILTGSIVVETLNWELYRSLIGRQSAMVSVAWTAAFLGMEDLWVTAVCAMLASAHEYP